MAENNPVEKGERRSAKRHKLDDRIQAVDQTTGKELGTIADLHEGGFMLVSRGAVVMETVYTVKLLLPRHINGCSEATLQAECLWISEAMVDSPDVVWAGFQIIPDSYRSLISMAEVIAEFRVD
ncbi:hypothetical protein [Halioxenophilus sp. WMMB6]|uniref:hypothetical protein n=1 Tax=Halioxenophilus sp. WMMB6 TaxID=3073815 RepID=UPI00295E9A91|nr:hypothetical protein [Halioxenophilus sp. WMMB6]